MKEATKVRRGREGFEQFYAEQWGSRWPALKEALLMPPHKVWLMNPFSDRVVSSGSPVDVAQELPIHLTEPGEATKAGSLGGLTPYYELDLASVLAAMALPLEPGQSWLDLCAAPGGKTLTKIFALKGEVLTTANDLSSDRVRRLKAVMHDHLPADVLTRMRVTHRDALKWRPAGDKYDAILLDAPCSGERHLLSRPQEMNLWSQQRTKRLAIRQHALLCTALELAKVGGYLLYSTCAVSPLENERVVERFLDRRRGRVEVCEAPVWLGERLRHGVRILPDQTKTGPIYYSLFRRLS